MALYYAKKSSLHGRKYKKGRGYPKAIAPPGQLSFPFQFGAIRACSAKFII